jgi:lipoic acid synthetase
LEHIKNGPGLEKFISDSLNVEETDWSNYKGKLRREKGEDERLRLPPWLKTKIPTGKFLAGLIFFKNFNF